MTFDEVEELHRNLVAKIVKNNELYFAALEKVTQANTLEDAQEIALQAIHHFPKP